MKKRVEGLDYLRAVSMILIILYHYTTRYEEIIGHQVVWSINVPWGCFAVKTFFVMTGYLTFANLKRGGGGKLSAKAHNPSLPYLLGWHHNHLCFYGDYDAGKTTKCERHCLKFHHVSGAFGSAER